MSDPKHLPHLLKLLDDESPVVQEAVAKELAALGPSLETELSRLPEPPDEVQRGLIRALLETYDGPSRLKKAWPDWLGMEEGKEKLEAAFTLLAEFQNGPNYPVKLKSLLDQLARQYDATHSERDAYELADFLFKIKGFRGAESDYYNPSNSNLVYVIEKKRGIPISLACIYILVGHRLWLNIEGCNFPGHFLARTYLEDRIVLVDCFNGGEFLDEKAITDMNPPESSQTVREILRMEADSETIISRVLRNLIGAYQQSNDQENRDLMLHLLKGLERHKSRRPWWPWGGAIR